MALEESPERLSNYLIFDFAVYKEKTISTTYSIKLNINIKCLILSVNTA
jgi:hypothetical protein